MLDNIVFSNATIINFDLKMEADKKHDVVIYLQSCLCKYQ